MPVTGRVDRDGRLVAADGPLAALQQGAGSDLGRPLALPQLAALARSALSLVVPLSRGVIAADHSHDLDLWVRAEPDDDGVTLKIERWTRRPAAPARLALVTGNGEASADVGIPAAEPEPLQWTTDAELHFTAVTPALAELLGTTESAAVGEPLTRLLRLIEDDDGQMPLLTALATHTDIAGQHAEARQSPGRHFVLTAHPIFDDDSRFRGFDGRAVAGEAEAEALAAEPTALIIDNDLDEALRSPLDRIVDAADRIADRSDGPLRSDYASYAGDIAAAARHLISVIGSMSDEAVVYAGSVDMASVVAEAVGLVEPAAEAQQVGIEVDRPEMRLLARGAARGIVQVLVNILGNAIRHSPPNGTVAVVFEQGDGIIAVTVADQGPGIAVEDQKRIFERYERLGTVPGGTGLGLAIARRLARSMDGDISLESAPNEGARFTLTLPAA